jgi:hypothetical protein
VNVTVSSSANITSGTCDMGGIETVNLSLVDTASENQLWQAVWIVHDVSVGGYVAAITVIDEDNTSYHTEVEWSVLPEEQPGEEQQNETQNGTAPPTNVTAENETANISIIPELSIWDDTDSQKRYVGEDVTFYANCSGHESIENVTCLISFNLGSWTEPERMNYSQGLYVYSRGFDAEGIVEFKVVCSTPGQGNTTVVSECVISSDKPDVFEPVTQIEIGKPVEWKQSFDVENNFTVNISSSAYNISVDDVVSENDVIVVENISKSLQEYNFKKGKDALAKEIKGLLQSIKRCSNEAPSQQELYQLYGMLKDNISFEEILNETYDDIEHYIDQFIFEDAEAQLILSNVSGEVEVKYFTEAPKILENNIDDSRKQITVYSDVHYENVFTYTSIVESPQNSVKLYWVVNGSYVLMSNTTYVDTNGNGFIDKIEWITPHLSNQTFEIVITKAEHLNENREFLSDTYDEVYRKDGIWSEPIYHHEYVRVTFEGNLTKNNDITLYVRNTQGLDTIVEVYYYNSDEKITEFPIIGEADFYKVYLTGMTGEHRTFDLRIKNLDNNNSAYLEFDYIVDPTGWVSPTGNADPSSQWTEETRAYDENTGTYASHLGAVGWRGFLELSLSSPIYCDRVRVYADFDTYYVDKVSIDIYNSTSWIEKYNGTITDCAWDELEFSAESNVTKARFRYHYITGSVYLWLFEFDFWQGQPLTLPNGTTLNATSIDETTAILKGNVSDDGGEPCEYRFQYGANTSYGTNTTWGGSEVKDSEFGTMIHSLTLGNTYQYRVQIRNSFGMVNGSNKNFTTAIPSLGWVTPTSHYDSNSQWSNEINVYDDDTDTYTRSYHDINDQDGLWSFFIYLNHSVLICDKVRFYARGPTGDPAQVDQVDLDVYRGGVWANVYEGTFSDKQWVEKSFMQGSVNQSRIRFRCNSANSGLWYQLYEFDCNKSRPVPRISNESPVNKSWGVSLTPQMNITVNNPDGANMMISWSSNSSGSWQLFGSNSSVGNGTYHQQNNNFSSNSMKYWWKISVTDGMDTNTSLYYFSTPDTIKPSSNVVAITPYWKTTSPITITATASDTGWSGLKNVTLYYRFSSNNASWGGWMSVGVDTASPWSWSFAFSNGSGFYQFYSIAKDNATNVESAPATNDANCGYDNVAPSSSVNAITSYWHKTSPLTIDGTTIDTGGSGLWNVTLWYRYSSDNNSWGGWVASGLVDSNPWVAVSWNFPFSNDTGYYEFYSIAKDNATNTESAPGSPDTICRYTYVTIPLVITNATTGVEKTNATLWGYLQSNGGENCTVRFEYGTSTNYGTNTTNQTKTTGRTFSADITSLTKGQLYYYRAFANNTLKSDYGDNVTFLTKPDPPNTLNAQPNSSSMIYLTWNTGMGANNTYIERNASGQTIWTRGQGEFVYNGSAIKYEDSGRKPGTTYYYQAWSFTTWTYNPTLSQYSDDNDSTSALTEVDISIGVIPLAWDQGTILIGSSNATTGFYFNLTNQGNVPIIVQIKATNATNDTTGAKWNLTGSSGLDNFSLQYKKSGDISWTTINLTYDTFMLNLPATGIDWLTFDLNLIMATTSSSTGDPLSLTITFKSVAV